MWFMLSTGGILLLEDSSVVDNSTIIMIFGFLMIILLIGAGLFESKDVGAIFERYEKMEKETNEREREEKNAAIMNKAHAKTEISDTIKLVSELEELP